MPCNANLLNKSSAAAEDLGGFGYGQEVSYDKKLFNYRLEKFSKEQGLFSA